MKFSEFKNDVSRVINYLNRVNILQILFLMTSVILLFSCDTVTNESGDDREFNIEKEWLVPEQEVVDGGPGKDGIPPIEDPEFAPVDQIDFIPDDRRVLGIKVGDEIRAYPHQILDWHEIVNDKYGTVNVTVTYCPLTATGIAWYPRQEPEFGTSGRIFRNNLVAYDRETGSFWVQMRLRAIHGPRMGESIEPLNVIETRWDTWKSMYPNSKVLTTKTGFNRDYESYAYGKDYSQDDGIILFPIRYSDDTRLNNKARVHGIIADESVNEDSPVRVYEHEKFNEGIEVVHDEFEDTKYVVIGSSSRDFAIAYKATLRDGTELSFESVQDHLPIVMEDDEGNKWNIFGEAVEGPRKGERLDSAKSYSGYWLAFRDMFRLPDIYQFDNP